MNWQHLLYQPTVFGGWSVKVWNPTTNAWQRSASDPHWPAEYEAAREWVELANDDQRERNAAVAAALAA
jgi:hypothetical protein